MLAEGAGLGGWGGVGGGVDGHELCWQPQCGAVTQFVAVVAVAGRVQLDRSCSAVGVVQMQLSVVVSNSILAAPLCYKPVGCCMLSSAVHHVPLAHC